MSHGTPFKLGNFAKGNKQAVALIIGEQAVDLASAEAAFRGAGRSAAPASTIPSLLETWDSSFPALQELVAFLGKEGVGNFALNLSEMRPLPPVPRPGKMFYAAQNFQEHVEEMIRAGMSGSKDPSKNFSGDKKTSRCYLFLKAPSCLSGAQDDIAIPTGMKKIDWEAEIACVIAKSGKRIKAEKALDHVAGFMTTNDVSCRDLQIREDRPGLRSDWLGGKCHDGFAPMGPYLVPKQFVGDHMKLFIRLTVNGVVKQDGNTSQFIYTPEEQIEYGSNMLSLQSGDIFVCGTCGGVGMGRGEFLKVGDVMETEVEGLGRMRNRFVEER